MCLQHFEKHVKIIKKVGKNTRTCNQQPENLITFGVWLRNKSHMNLLKFGSTYMEH
jgi:hypothetical protein